MPEFTQWETDIREVARKTIDEQKFLLEDASKGLFSIFSNTFD